ncbi:MAG TPA: hypothetical protein DEP18_03820 [Flavobacteriales bacterium]|nr:hypothetical protein [Flavobacteriales bacterium]HRJ31315.1 DUF433 domain-containing protein [Cyclobacteriaceae bacterium]HRJ80736.1 DUF433 domain-containing protein [Cyclobacteriaceae bacterium]
MEWREHITSNREILGGKPIIKGTRLSVEFLLGLFANGWSEEKVLKNYPTLKKDDILALFAYAQNSVKDDLLISLKS